ncbi:hypothetical protein HaLaN_29569 [Haematococcus lacustris]|uniref:Uncharacterized protein n=1 Tax=Haematococcus lacustris TaxID=44745 RepID=A0A6A0ADD8_HAELA|nr:hypothetical protein HaLaN_29569 [Haematococcus lacustris]
MAVVYKYHHACFRPGNALVSSRRRLAVLGVAAYAMAAYASAHKELRILAFGDSLTEGYYRVPSQQQPAFHPYTKRLQSLLHQNLPAPCCDGGGERGAGGAHHDAAATRLSAAHAGCWPAVPLDWDKKLRPSSTVCSRCTRCSHHSAWDSRKQPGAGVMPCTLR